MLPDRADLQQILREGLLKEWDWRLPSLSQKKIVSIYFGGGTPTLFAPYLRELLILIRQTIDLAEDCELTIEANPEEATLALLTDLRSLGFNRLSLGVQSLDDSSLQVLERRHSVSKAIQAIEYAYQAGFSNISIDLMFDLPGQTLMSWQTTLDRLTILPITHLSLYNLTIEPHTVFFKRKDVLKRTMPKDEESLEMLQRGIKAFERLGLKRYEISAFAQDGFQSRHNIGYWTGRSFLGFGPSAFSYWEGKRFSNESNLLRYRRSLVQGISPIGFSEELTYPENVLELLAVRLRLFSKVNLAEWNLPSTTFITLNRFRELGFLEQEGTSWKLSEQGALFYDEIAAELIGS